MSNIEALIRAKRPKASLEADHKRSRSTAIHLHCLSCCNGSRREAVDCGSFDCFLWPFRPGAGANARPEGSVPSVEEYQARVVEQAGGEEAMAALRERGKALFGKVEKRAPCGCLLNVAGDPEHVAPCSLAKKVRPVRPVRTARKAE